MVSSNIGFSSKLIAFNSGAAGLQRSAPTANHASASTSAGDMLPDPVASEPDGLIRFDLTKSSVPAFETDSARLALLADQFKTQFNTIAEYAQTHQLAEHETLAASLTLLHERLFNPTHPKRFGAEVRGQFYQYCVSDLQKICQALGDASLTHSDAEDILSNLSSGIVLCGGGARSNILTAARQLYAATQGMIGLISKKREELFFNLVADFCRLQHGEHDSYVLMEVHYANAYAHEFGNKYNIPMIESDEYLKSAQAKIKPYEYEAAEKIVDQQINHPHLIAPLLAEAYEAKFLKALGSGNHDMLTDWPKLTDLQEELSSTYGAIDVRLLVDINDAHTEFTLKPNNSNNTLLQLNILQNMDKQGLISAPAASKNVDPKLSVGEVVSPNIFGRLLLGRTQQNIYEFNGLLWTKEAGNNAGPRRHLLQLDDLNTLPAFVSVNSLDPEDPDRDRVKDFTKDIPALVIEGLRNTPDLEALKKFQERFPAQYEALKLPTASRQTNTELLVSLAELSQYAASADTKIQQHEMFQYLVNNGANVHEAFSSALQKGYGAAVTSLIDFLALPPSNLAIRNQQGQQLLHLAAECSNHAAVSQLISKGVKVDEPDAKGFTPLHLVCSSSAAKADLNAAIAKDLIAQGANAQHRTRDHQLTPLDLAAKSGNLPVLDQLLQSGAKVNALQPTTELSAANFAVRYCRNPAILKTLLDAGADYRIKTEIGRFNLLIDAIHHNNPSAVEVLLDLNYFELHKSEDYGRSPLEHAVESGYGLVLDVLLKHDTAYQLNKASDLIRMSHAVHTAVSHQNIDALRKILENCPDADKRRQILHLELPTGDNIFETAVMKKSRPVLMYLLELKQDNVIDADFFNHKNKFGFTALHYWAGAGQHFSDETLSQAIPFLVTELGINPEVFDARGMTPLMEATIRNRTLLIRALKEAGANPNTRTQGFMSYKNTALHLLVSERVDARYQQAAIFATMDELLAPPNGADINAKNGAGLTPLMLAIKENNIETVKHLLEQGADLSIRDNGLIPRTALQRAQGRLNANPRAVELIEITAKLRSSAVSPNAPTANPHVRESGEI